MDMPMVRFIFGSGSKTSGENQKSTLLLRGPETTLAQLNFLIGRRGPDEIGAVGVDIHAVP
jgi:hypothetical protein